MSQHLAIIREIFPSQVCLTPKEIARVLHGPGKDTKSRVEDVRRQLDEGTLIPGLRKRSGQKRWLVKIVDLAMALDMEAASQPRTTSERYYTPAPYGRFKNPGRRLIR